MSRILIVEDERVTAQVIQEFLTNSEHTAIANARSATEAVSMAAAGQPDLVLMDIYLEGEGDGITAADDIHRQFGIPVIYLTSSTEKSILQRAIATQPFGYFIKPFNSTELRAAIHIALQRHQLEKRLQQTETVLRQQAERERLLSAIAQRIRESLQLEDILNTTVAEVRQLLQTDRVIIYRFQPDQSGDVIVESVGAGWTSMHKLQFTDTGLIQDRCITPYLQGQISSVEDIYAADLPQCYVEMLAAYQVRANLVIPILQGDRLWGLLAAQHCAAPRPWQPWEIDLLRELSAQLSIALQQSQLYRQMQHQSEREQSLNRVTQGIRNSLELETIFANAAAEIGRLLQVDRASIVRFFPERKIWLSVSSYRRSPEVPDTVGLEIPDEGNLFTAQLKRLEVVQVYDYATTPDGTCLNLAQRYSGALLLVPLQVNSGSVSSHANSPASTVWGSLSLNRLQPWVWQEPEVELAKALANQLAIAIQQSQLYQQVQQFNAHLEEQVQERTAQLQQAFSFEATLKRITDRVRDSLDENHILQTAVGELALAIGVDTCNVALYDLEQRTSTICYEYTALPSNFQAYTISMSIFQEGYQQLLQGQHFQFCGLSQLPQNRVATLLCPIWDDQGVLGDLWLSHHPDFIFSEPDIRLVQQVANQCAIALRQFRLYQAAQAQVTELERLNRLKDDFLSTVSHELRTPMSNIRMAIQMLEILLSRGERDSGLSTSRLPQYLQILRDECEREISLIDNLLNLSQLEAGTEPLVLSTIDLSIWLDHAIEPLVEKITERQQLVLDLPEGLPRLTTDLSCLERILTELVNNAYKYSPSGETISVFARVVAAAVPQAIAAGLQIGVSNSGVEIAPEEIPRIFDKFYRIPSSDPWQHGGTGLGLALVQRLVTHLGATIQVESADSLTTFIVSFPGRSVASD